MKVIIDKNGDKTTLLNVDVVEIGIAGRRFELKPMDDKHLLVRTPEGVMRMQGLCLDILCIEEVRP
jgi:hypothetical protein